MSLAAKLPYDHPYAGGYPGIGSQPLPTDADAIDYLSRMATADGAGVETGVAVAVDAFFRGLKATGVFDALKACCILAGARTLAGALVPVVGNAPTNVADGFVEGDYSRTAGLTGDGTSYIDSGRANDADPQNDVHAAAYLTASATGASYVIGANGGGSNHTIAGYDFWCRSLTGQGPTSAPGAGLNAVSRNSSASFTYVDAGSAVQTSEKASATQSATNNMFVFAFNNAGSPSNTTDATIAFYSIGTAVDLEALDTAVTNLITAIGNAL